MNFLQNPYVKAGLAVGACLLVARFVPVQSVKAAAFGVAGVIVARNTPFIRDTLA